MPQLVEVSDDDGTAAVVDPAQLAEHPHPQPRPRRPTVIGGHAFTTGAIARTGFETVQPAAQIELGMRDGAGCDAPHFNPEERAGPGRTVTQPSR
jgi:7,8-dihydropterin-6-yl-methyl-4-(beta-D-ribofuranosyl)aminobenzene 5'-phosphate synthase